MPSSTFASMVRVFWMSERSGGLERMLLWAGALSAMSRGWIIGCEMNAFSAGLATASLSGGLRGYDMVQEGFERFINCGKV
jgi:hypothetical protein